VQGPARLVERISSAASVTVDGLLDPAAAPIQRVAGEANDVEGVHDRCRVG
jgi:hypothetical protein